MRQIKRITRKVDIHRYLFGCISEHGGITVNAEYEFTVPLSRDDIKNISEKIGQPLLKHEVNMQYFSMPLNDFVRLCRELQTKGDNHNGY